MFNEELNQHLELFNKLFDLRDDINRIIDACTNVLAGGGKLMFCGNGGSAADSQHLAAEFTGRFIKDREPLAALALSTDTSVLTCIGNDYSFNEIYSRQIKGIGKQGDCLFAISTSGNSLNVIQAVKECKDKGILTVGLIGNDGGQLKSFCDISVIAPSSVTARIQEAHIFIGHIICGSVEKKLGLV